MHTQTVDSSQMTDLSVPEGCGYNQKFFWHWALNTHGVSGSIITWCNKNCVGKFGWHFMPNSFMNYDEDDWFKNQEAFLSFEYKEDLLQAKLSISHLI